MTLALDAVPMVAAHPTRIGGSLTAPRLIVLHTIDANVGEVQGRARAQAAAWQFPIGQGPNPEGAAHYTTDNSEIVQSVPLNRQAPHAGGVNGWSIGIEQVGGAAQSTAQWLDTYSLAQVANTARLCAALCTRYGIPPVRTIDARNGSGIIGHAEVSAIYYSSGGHWDPGPYYPWPELLFIIGLELGGIPGHGGDDMPTPDTITAAFPRRRPGGVTQGTVAVDAKGGVYAYDGADYYGSLMDYVSTGALPPRIMGVDHIVSGLSTEYGDGYWLLGKDGSVFTFQAPFYGRPAFAEGRFAVALTPYAAGYAVVDSAGDRHPFIP